MIYRWQVTRVSSVYQYQYACLVCLFVYTSLVHMDKKLLSFGILMTFFLFFPLFFDRICFSPLPFLVAKSHFISLHSGFYRPRGGGTSWGINTGYDIFYWVSDIHLFSRNFLFFFPPLFSNVWERKYDLVKLEVCLMPLAGYMLPCRRSTKPRLRLIFSLLSKMLAIF